MIDMERCIGCKSCEVACKMEHGLGPGEYRNRVLWLRDLARPSLDFLTLACQHCERPACLRACTVTPKAIEKDPVSGVVRIDEARCTGCGECVVACPYGAMGYDATDHHAVKCDLCVDRRAEGRTTACANVCPGKAIRFGERDALINQARRENRDTLDQDAFALGPATIYLQRIKNRPTSSAATALGDHDSPVVIDQPGGRLGPDDTTFPYRTDRPDREPDESRPGGCNICFNTCSTRFHFRQGRLVSVTGNDDDPLYQGRVCPKSQLSLQLYNSKNRLTRPLKRIGARGEGRFEPISWNQALDEIAGKLTSLRDQFGAEALGIYAGTRTGLISKKGYVELFAQMWGTPNVADTEAFCSQNKNLMFGTVLGAQGSGNSYTEADMGSAGMYLYFGDNQAETRPVHFGMINDWRLKNDARMVVVDPRLTVTASKADQWLAIRSGTDLALALALSHHILERGLQDRRFCENWIVGWEQWRDQLFERGYDPDWAAPITGIEADQIRALARDIAEADGCVIFASRGINQHSNGGQTNRALMFLAAITGNWGRKGGTYFNMATAPPIQVSAPSHRRPPIDQLAIRYNVTGWTDAMTTGKPYPLKALIANNNPMAQWPDQSAVRQAMNKLDLIVHIDLFENETSAYADYVLPAATGIEKGEIGRGNEDRRVVWIDKMIDPPGEAKADGWIWIELGKRFGFDDVLKEEYKDPAVFWDEMCINHPQMRGITQRRLHATPWRWVRFPVESESSAEIDTLYLEGTTAHGAPEGHRFPTASGKLEFWTEDQENRFAQIGLSAAPRFYTDAEQLIDLPYMTPIENDEATGIVSPFLKRPTGIAPGHIVEPGEGSPGRVLRSRGFDTELVTGRPPAPQFHSWMHYAWQAQEMWPDLYVQIHPDKAADAGIADGERVRIETSHGNIEARAWLHAGIRSTSVFVPIGWGEKQPFHPWRPVNYLTDKRQRDPISDNSNLKTYLCRISPV